MHLTVEYPRSPLTTGGKEDRIPLSSYRPPKLDSLRLKDTILSSCTGSVGSTELRTWTDGGILMHAPSKAKQEKIIEILWKALKKFLMDAQGTYPCWSNDPSQSRLGFPEKSRLCGEWLLRDLVNLNPVV